MIIVLELSQEKLDVTKEQNIHKSESKSFHKLQQIYFKLKMNFIFLISLIFIE